MELWLIRHAQTEWSVAGRHTGRTDIRLSDEGRLTAAAIDLPRRDWALVLSSPLSRARETAALCGFSDRVADRDDLMEWDYGDYEGITTPAIREQRPDWDLWTMGAPGGESPGDVGARADRMIDEALAAGGDVIAFAHGHIIRVLGARWTQQPVAFGGRLKLDTAAVCCCSFERETRVISRWNTGGYR
ncbi:MAG TPA: histidine phosphatase family protein [Baekduia sp.]|nr:histidine phosphatase family protein [Baekduia sp.]